MTISRPPEEAGGLYRVEDLLNVVKVGDTVADLKRFINRWDATIAGMPEPPHENVLRDILLRQIRTSSILRYDIDLFDRAKEGDRHRSYKFLLQSIKDLIDRERLRENRSRIAERNRLKPGDRSEKNAAPGIDPRRKRSPSRGRPTSRDKGVCWAFLDRKCTKGKDCKFKHEKPKRDPSRRRQPSKEKKEQRDKSEDKETKKMTKEEMAKTPCRYDQQGTRRWGDKCFFKHGDKAAPAAKTKARKEPPLNLERKRKGTQRTLLYAFAIDLPVWQPICRVHHVSRSLVCLPCVVDPSRLAERSGSLGNLRFTQSPLVGSIAR